LVNNRKRTFRREGKKEFLTLRGEKEKKMESGPKGKNYSSRGKGRLFCPRGRGEGEQGIAHGRKTVKPVKRKKGEGGKNAILKGRSSQIVERVVEEKHAPEGKGTIINIPEGEGEKKCKLSIQGGCVCRRGPG